MEKFVGTISVFGFNFPPVGWLQCNGQLVAISEYELLYTLIGTTYGGDGINTFGIPDLRGRSVINQGQGPGLSKLTIGQSAGTDSIAISVQNLPQHVHPLVSTQVTAQTKIYAANAGNGTNEPGQGQYALGSGGDFPAIFSDSTTKGTAEYLAGIQNNAPMNTLAIGGNIPLDITNPYMGVNFCICTYGLFPSQG